MIEKTITELEFLQAIQNEANRLEQSELPLIEAKLEKVLKN